MIIENDKVYTFKIANGDEIIGKVVGQTETGIVLHQPLTIIPSQQRHNQTQSFIAADSCEHGSVGSKACVLIQPCCGN